MSRALYQIQEIGRNVKRIAGVEVEKKVMEGSEKIGASAKQPKPAQWAKGAMERLDASVDGETRSRIMRECGRNCAKKNTLSIQRGKARRKKFASEEEFLAAEQENPQKGTRLERKGDSLIQVYTPREYTRPMRCYCGLMSGLPESETVSPTYCQCSCGFVEAYWEGVLGRSVDVALLHSAVSGARECAFRIRLS